jgi:hypothetical protein
MSTATLLCKQCNFENEPERVYCHNCGAKLDRALLPPEAIKREDPQAVQNRVRSVVRPRGARLSFFLRNLLFSLVVAVVLASLYLIARPPVGQPNLSEETVMSAPPISDNLEDMVQSPSTRRVLYTEEQANAFLQATLRAKEASSFGIPVKYIRTYVHFTEGRCRTTVQESVAGYSFFFSTTDGVELRNGQIIPHPAEGSIGRLRIPAKAMPAFEKALGSVWAALDPYKKLVSRLGSINFHKGSVEVAGKAGAGS